jgi:hypothetical protein
MKGIITKYLGPNVATVKAGGKELTVRIPVNRPHPEVGIEIEFKEASCIISMLKISEGGEIAGLKKKEVEEDKPLEVSERGEIHGKKK